MFTKSIIFIILILLAGFMISIIPKLSLPQQYIAENFISTDIQVYAYQDLNSSEVICYGFNHEASSGSKIIPINEISVSADNFSRPKLNSKSGLKLDSIKFTATSGYLDGKPCISEVFANNSLIAKASLQVDNPQCLNLNNLIFRHPVQPCSPKISYNSEEVCIDDRCLTAEGWLMYVSSML